jgi:hypothetical protein
VPLPAAPLTRRPSIGSQLAAAVAGVGLASAGLWRRNPLEGTAVVLLILAGLIYPFPVGLVAFFLWLIGILLALPSRLWDTRDKWTGLATPVFAAVIGAAIALAVGGSHQSVRPYLHEIAATGPPLLRATVVLGALYLAWRIRRGPRSPAVPPWNRPHRV